MEQIEAIKAGLKRNRKFAKQIKEIDLKSQEKNALSRYLELAPNGYPCLMYWPR